MDGYYLIGERLGHSFSPELHRAFGRCDYGLKELSAEELGPFLERRSFAGLNVTIPFKQAVLPYLDRLEPQAAAIGAVNTVVNRNGTLWGYNTDYGGMKASIQRLGIDLRGKTALVLGTGGTSKTALAVCRALGAAGVFQVSRSGKNGALRYESLHRSDLAPDLLINCTPVGTWPDLDGRPPEIEALTGLRAVFDCVYNPLRTRLVLEARARGIPAEGGLEMLVRQAALACELFTGEPVSEQTLGRVLDGLRRQRENLVLIGMPGAGKTTVGRLLAQKNGKEFVDLDEELERRTGKTIASIFAERGEAHFRELEAALIAEIAGTGGRIVAAGGGAVLRAENVRRLKQNGRLFLLDRPLEALLPSPARPLGDTAEKLARLWDERSSVYAAAADVRVDNSGSLEQTVSAVLRA